MVDRLLLRGRVLTFDTSRPLASSILLEGGRVAAIDPAGRLDAATVELSDGEVIQPGYVDDHVHLLATAAAGLSVEVSAAPDNAAVLEMMRRHVDGSGWMRAWGYDEGLLNQPMLQGADLDSVSATQPIVLHHRTGHVVILNRAARAALGSTDDSGVVVEGHELLAQVPRPPVAELAAAVVGVLDAMSAAGIVRCVDATHTNDLQSLEFLDELAPESGPAIEAMVGATNLETLGGHRPGSRVGSVTVGHAKVMPSIADDASVDHLVDRARQHGFPVAVHVMDIDTLALSIDSLQRRPGPGGDRIEHCALALPEQLDQLGGLGVRISTQPSFVVERAAKYRRELSSVEQEWLWPLRDLLTRRLEVGFGSDAPVVASNPDHWIQAATERQVGAAQRIDEATALGLAMGGGQVTVGAAAADLVIASPQGYRPVSALSFD